MTNGYECWIWTELLAFDCEAPDCGAAAYLERIGFVPTGISFLLSSPDFGLKRIEFRQLILATGCREIPP